MSVYDTPSDRAERQAIQQALEALDEPPEGLEATNFIMLRRALRGALPWLYMIAREKGRPETSAIHSVVREVEAALKAERLRIQASRREGTAEGGKAP